MERAIYGLAMPFNDCYWTYDKETNTFKFEKTNKESVFLDRKVGITLNHDYSKELGITGDNLFMAISENGLFFKLIPNNPLSYSIYKKVKRRELRHCSVSYLERKFYRDIEEENRVKESLPYTQENIEIINYKKIYVFEVCLTNTPANDATFCTINKDHKLLQGLKWNEPIKTVDAVAELVNDGFFDKEDIDWLSSFKTNLQGGI